MGSTLLLLSSSLAVLLTEETLTVLSSRFQVTPPSVEIRNPTPGASEPCWPLLSPPVAAMMIDWLGSWFLGKMVMLAMLMAALGPKLVSGIQVGPLGLVVRKSV